MTRPVALSCGDPGGVGVEIALKAAVELQGHVPFFMIADTGHVQTMADELALPFHEIETPENLTGGKGLPVLHHRFPRDAGTGGPVPENASATIAVIERAVHMVRDGVASALCTNPINKKVLQDGARFAYPGHTEFLAHLAGVDRSVMMLFAPELKVVPVTIHIALEQVKAALTGELLSETIRIANQSLKRDFGIQEPRIAVAGLNPHAGEGGSMGTEELTLINPVLQSLRDEGINVGNARSADTMFHAAAREGYDLAVCMYHDQALIPIKTLNFSGGVNATLGLPFIRTSPDHGTAYDIAGKGIADPESLIAALTAAHDMVQQRERFDVGVE